MTLFLDRYLTEYDESLSSDSYIDPVGTLVIWSIFGRQVFNNRVNSISNDVRNYTLNLFHHFLIRKLVNDDAATLSGSLRRKYRDKDTLLFKQACLVFLENLFVYSALRHEHERPGDVETGGILGIFKARRRWEETGGDPVVMFTHEAAGQILVRQLGLGVSGRYKTPLREIGFFDDSYQYNKLAFQSHWADAEAFISGTRDSLLGKLSREVYPFLKKCVAKLPHRGKLQFADEIPKGLTEAYARAFASRGTVGSYARDFWLQQTGLSHGAAGALFTVLEEKTGQELSPQQVLEQALLLELQSEEKIKLERIAQIEPFLADCTLLFTLMAAERTHSVTTVARHWGQFGRDMNRLPSLAQQVKTFSNLPAVKGSEAARRLLELQRVANAGAIEHQIRALATYHGNVMRSRGQLAWLSVEYDGTIKMNARTMRRPLAGERPLGSWHNNYYLPQFRSLVTGLQGIET